MSANLNDNFREAKFFPLSLEIVRSRRFDDNAFKPRKKGDVELPMSTGARVGRSMNLNTELSLICEKKRRLVS